MTQQEIKDRLHHYIVKETMSDANHINDDTLLFEQGIFDSIGLLLLIEFIKDEFKVTTSDDDLLMENFESINSISIFITKKIVK
jgi:acyl carrier protein